MRFCPLFRFNGYQMGVLAGLELLGVGGKRTAVHGFAAVGTACLRHGRGFEGALASMAIGSLLRWYLFKAGVMDIRSRAPGTKTGS